MYNKLRQDLADLDAQAATVTKDQLNSFSAMMVEKRTELFDKRAELLQKVHNEFAELIDEILRIESKARDAAMAAQDDGTAPSSNSTTTQ